MPRQAATDAQLVGLWIHGRPPQTMRAYAADARRFLSFVGKPIHGITLGDIQAYADQLEASGIATATRHRRLAVVKSLFAFGHRIGYLQFDVSRPIRLPAIRETLPERILSEGDIQKMLILEENPRNHAILYCLYGAGVRASELVGLRWRDLAERDDGQGQISVWGKGQKTRNILIPAQVWQAMTSLRGTAGDDAPVFRSRKGGHLRIGQLWRIVKAAAQRAEIEKAVSTHWWRHAHASHALDRGCPIHLVQATLGHSSVATTGRYLHARPSESSGKYLPL
jgi:integrase/recombinase XerD